MAVEIHNAHPGHLSWRIPLHRLNQRPQPVHISDAGLPGQPQESRLLAFRFLKRLFGDDLVVNEKVGADRLDQQRETQKNASADS